MWKIALKIKLCNFKALSGGTKKEFNLYETDENNLWTLYENTPK